MDGHFDDPRLELASQHQHLRVDQGALRVETHAVQEVAANQLEGTVDVARQPAEKQSHQREERPGVEPARQWVPTTLPVAGHDVPLPRPGQQQAELHRVKLVVGIHEEDPGKARRVKSRSQRGAVSPIHRMPDHPQAGMRGLEPVEHAGGAVLAAVVDHDDLEGARVRLERPRHAADRLLQVGRLVESR